MAILIFQSSQVEMYIIYNPFIKVTVINCSPPARETLVLPICEEVSYSIYFFPIVQFQIILAERTAITTCCCKGGIIFTRM